MRPAFSSARTQIVIRTPLSGGEEVLACVSVTRGGVVVVLWARMGGIEQEEGGKRHLACRDAAGWMC